MQSRMFKQGGMLDSVRSKIAHTSTVPAFGNKDLKRLQDLIITEKDVMLKYVSHSLLTV